jgi:hypothetical protein
MPPPLRACDATPEGLIVAFALCAESAHYLSPQASIAGGKIAP